MNSICPRCKTIVYHAEKMTGPGGAWHKTCLTCKECSKRLDSYNLTEREGEAYCKTCYNRAWGPKGYGYAGGAAFLTTETKMPSPTKTTFTEPAFTEPTFTEPTFAEPTFAEPTFAEPTFTEPTFAESTFTKPALAQRASDKEVADEEWDAEPTPTVPKRWSRGGAMLAPILPYRPIPLEARVDSPRPTTPPPQSTGITVLPADVSPRSSMVLSSNPSRAVYGVYGSNTGGGGGGGGRGYVPKKMTVKVRTDTCRGCGKAVYAAESVMGAGHKYHKLCLKCYSCNRLVDATTMVDREAKVYCRACYAKEFGPKGYGYAGGAAFLTTGEYNG